MGFWLLLPVYFIVAVAVIRWTVIKALGFWVCTPQLFIKYPTVYKLVSLALLLVTVIVGLASDVPWYFVLLIVLVARTAALWLGKKLAFAKYRQEVLTIPDTDPEELKADSRRTDKELWELAQLGIKHDI